MLLIGQWMESLILPHIMGVYGLTALAVTRHERSVLVYIMGCMCLFTVPSYILNPSDLENVATPN